jgi:DNA replication protein DnaC
MRVRLRLAVRPHMLLVMARADCPVCHGDGWRILEEGETPNGESRLVAASDDPSKRASEGKFGTSHRFAVLCECTSSDRRERELDRARIPQRYRHCNFENFEADIGYDHGTPQQNSSWNRSIEQAKLLVEGFARDFPVGTEHGMLLIGPCGVGKTHLAVAALQQVLLRGHSGLFYDYRELLKEIQASYNPDNPSTEMGVLEPVLTAEILLLDDLGSSKPSLWALETVGHILNTRYNENRVTVLTTNYLDTDTSAAHNSDSRLRFTIEDSLSDRVGARIRSRLYEMCRTIQIFAPDYRKEIRKAEGFTP